MADLSYGHENFGRAERRLATMDAPLRERLIEARGELVTFDPKQPGAGPQMTPDLADVIADFKDTYPRPVIESLDEDGVLDVVNRLREIGYMVECEYYEWSEGMKHP
jgi:hypothetical protein